MFIRIHSLEWKDYDGELDRNSISPKILSVSNGHPSCIPNLPYGRICHTRR